MHICTDINLMLLSNFVSVFGHQMKQIWSNVKCSSKIQEQPLQKLFRILDTDLRFKYSLSNYANIYSISCIYTMYAESTDWPLHQKSGIFVLAILVLCRYVFLQKSIVVVHLCSKTFEKHLSAEESPDLRPSRIFAQVHGILMEMENVFPVKSFTKC